MNTNNENKMQEHRDRDANRDAITGEHGSHPVGTGVGAAGGGITGAAIGSIGGPVGAAIGLVAGAVVGGLAGKGVAEQIDPTLEEKYWETNYRDQKYVEGDAPYTMYQPAYRTGYEGRNLYPGKRFEEVESELERDYQESRGASSLSWEKAKNAVRDAWNRAERAIPGDFDGDGR